MITDILQDKFGLYKTYKTKNEQGKEVEEKRYISNFQIDNARRIVNLDTTEEMIELTLISCLENKITKMGSVAVFEDVKTFRNFLASVELTWTGMLEDLFDLKTFILANYNKNTEKMYSIGGIKKINGNNYLVTKQGLLAKSNNICKTTYAESELDINIDVPTIEKEELERLLPHLFNFNIPEITYSVLGQVGIMYLNPFLKEIGEKLNYMCIFGESGSGKTTTVDKVIIPMMNIKYDAVNVSTATTFALTKLSASNNLAPLIIEEYKPSTLSKYKNNELSNFFRNVYDGFATRKGNKDMSVTIDKPISPLIVMGEENFGETALLERSNIIYFARLNKKNEYEDSVKFLSDNMDLLNKLGKSLMLEVLAYDSEKVKENREKIRKFIREKHDIKDRVLNTAVNVVTGIAFISKVIKKIDDEFQCNLEEIIQYIVNNIKENVLGDAKETKTGVEQILETFDSMIELNNDTCKIVEGVDFKILKDNTLALDVKCIYPKFRKYIRDYNVNSVDGIDEKVFTKQLRKTKYFIDYKPVKFDDKLKKAYVLNFEEIKKLDIVNILEYEVDKEVVNGTFGKVVNLR